MYLRFSSVVVVFGLSHTIAGCNFIGGKSGDDTSAETETASGTGECDAMGLRLMRPVHSKLALQDGTINTGALAVGEAVTTELSANLLALGLSPEQAQFIAGSANEHVAVVAGPLSITTEPITVVAPAAVKGAFASLNTPCAFLTDDGMRLRAASYVVTSVTGSLKGRTGELNADGVDNVIGSMAGEAVRSIPAAAIGGSLTGVSVSAIASAMVTALPSADIAKDRLGQSAQSIAGESVKSLPLASVPAEKIGELAGKITASSVAGIGEVGLSPAEIIESKAIANIVKGAASGLKVAAPSDVSASLGAIAAAAVGALADAGMDSAALKQSAIQDVTSGSIEGAKSLAGEDVDALAGYMSDVAMSVVLALPGAGVGAAEIAGFTSAVVGAALSTAATLGFDEAGDLATIASKVVEGAMAGTAELAKSKTISEAQAKAAIESTGSGVVAALASFIEDGLITEVDDISGFLSGVARGLLAGFESAGSSASLLASIQESVADSITSGDVFDQLPLSNEAKEEIKNAIAEAVTPAQGAVAALEFSVQSGSYSAAQSVAITTSTVGAKIRFTIDGSAPTETSGTIYSAPISVTDTTTIKAIGYKDNHIPAQRSAKYEFLFKSSRGTAALADTVWGLEAADFNGDNILDLAAPRSDAADANNGFELWLGKGDGAFEDMQFFSVSLSGFNPEFIKTGDLDKDGKIDVLLGTSSLPNRFAVVRNKTPPGSAALMFENPDVYSVSGSYPRPLDLADINGDGYLDLAVAMSNGNEVEVFLGDKDNPGALLSPSSVFFVAPSAVWPTMLMLRDVNGDAKADIVAAHYADKFSVLLSSTASNAATPSFSNPVDFNVEGSDLWDFDMADLNGDGKIDLYIESWAAGKTSVYLNTTAANAATPSFATPLVFTHVGQPTDVAVADMNGDGKPDLLAAEDISGSGGLTVRYGKGDGTFEHPMTFPGSLSAWGMVVAELNGDGRPDVATSSYGAPSVVTIFLNGLDY